MPGDRGAPWPTYGLLLGHTMSQIARIQALILGKQLA